MNMKEIRRILPEDLRSLCIKRDWYTRGTNEDYDKLMDKCRDKNGSYKKLSLKDIYWMGYDIFMHSDDNDMGIPESSYLEYICSSVLKECDITMDIEWQK